MKKNLMTLIFLSILSCNKLDETKTEVNAVQKVLNFYNGECFKSKGFETKNGIEKNYYELVMSKSTLLKNDSQRLKLHSANVAYLFYSNLKDEKSNYDEIRVKINLDGGKTQSFKYSEKELTEIERLMPKINGIEKNILVKDYEKITTQFDKSIGIKKENIEELFNNLESLHGKIKDFQFQGFASLVIDDYGEIILIREAVILEKLNGNMILILDKKSKNLLSIEFP